MICDLAEYYHITDYRSLPPMTVAALVVGLREESRIVQKRNGVKAPQDTLLLASIVDRLGLIITAITGTKTGEQLLEKFIEDTPKKEKTRDFETFSTVDDYLKARYGGN